MITAAYAATEAVHHEAFYSTATFWAAIAFVLLFGFLGKKIYIAITGMLDARADKIRAELDEAAKLREEAQDLLATYQKKQRDAQKEAKAIITHAREEAERITKEAAIQLDGGLKRREQMAMDRIAHAETKAMDEIRALAVDVAIEATRTLLSENISDAKSDALVDQAIKDLADKLH